MTLMALRCSAQTTKMTTTKAKFASATKVDFDRFAPKNTHRVGRGEFQGVLEEGVEVQDVPQEGREGVEEDREVPEDP